MLPTALLVFFIVFGKSTETAYVYFQNNGMYAYYDLDVCITEGQSQGSSAKVTKQSSNTVVVVTYSDTNCQNIDGQKTLPATFVQPSTKYQVKLFRDSYCSESHAGNLRDTKPSYPLNQCNSESNLYFQIKCGKGYKEKNGDCEEGSEEPVCDDYCIECISNGNCRTCNTGFKPHNGVCYMCNNIQHCTECDYNNHCTSCDTGYTANNGECVKNNEPDGDNKIVYYTNEDSEIAFAPLNTCVPLGGEYYIIQKVTDSSIIEKRYYKTDKTCIGGSGYPYTKTYDSSYTEPNKKYKLTYYNGETCSTSLNSGYLSDDEDVPEYYKLNECDVWTDYSSKLTCGKGHKEQNGKCVQDNSDNGDNKNEGISVVIVLLLIVLMVIF